MARARNIKPGFFKNEALADSSCETRLLFIGLWTLADREGRLEDRPRRIRAEIFPFDGFDVESMLNELQSLGFLTRYEVDGSKFIQITNFVKHQDPHYREKASEIAPMAGLINEIVATGVTRTQRSRILERDDYKCQHCGSTEHPCIDHVIPVSKGGDSSDDNLQVLCLSCNTKKGNKINETLIQRRVDVESSKLLNVPLIPDSLIPDSLIPDSLIPETSPAKSRGDEYSPDFERAWECYPKRPGASKKDSFKAWSARLKAGVPASEMMEGVLRYAAYVIAKQTEPEFIKQPATFFGPGDHFRADWTAQPRASPGKPEKFDPTAYANRNFSMGPPKNERIVTFDEHGEPV